jgi:hypothetical protein
VAGARTGKAGGAARIEHSEAGVTVLPIISGSCKALPLS